MTPSAALEKPSWGDGWTAGLRVWLEREGQAILGKGRQELLEAIDRNHSISGAARQLGMSYRHAWLQVQQVNEAAGTPLVVAATGGTHGGGATLTPQGRWAVRLFRTLDQHIRQAAAGILSQLVQGEPGETIHVAAAVSLEEVLGQLLADWALRQPALPVRAIYGASDELATHVLRGAPADLFLTADAAQLDRLTTGGVAVAKERRVLARNGLAAIASADSAPAVRKPADLTRPDVGRIALAVPSCPLGSYTRAFLEGLGLHAALAGQAVWVENSRAAVSAVQAGQAAVGLVYASDAARAIGSRVLFQARRLPRPIHYVAAILGRNPRAPVRAFLEYLTSAPARRRFRRGGFLSPPKR